MVVVQNEWYKCQALLGSVFPFFKVLTVHNSVIRRQGRTLRAREWGYTCVFGKMHLLGARSHENTVKVVLTVNYSQRASFYRVRRLF